MLPMLSGSVDSIVLTWIRRERFSLTSLLLTCLPQQDSSGRRRFQKVVVQNKDSNPVRVGREQTPYPFW